MNSIYSSRPREVQTIRCCGRIYKRWRWVGKRFFDRGGRPTHATKCAICGEHLTWPINFEPQSIAAVRREEAKEGYYDQRVNWLLQGRTSHGQPFRRTPNYLSEAEKLAARRRRGLTAWNKRAAKFKAAALTTRGTIPKRRPLPAIERAWRTERATITVNLPTFDDVYRLTTAIAYAHAIPGMH